MKPGKSGILPVAATKVFRSMALKFVGIHHLLAKFWVSTGLTEVISCPTTRE
jgi:hypothetical protein